MREVGRHRGKSLNMKTLEALQTALIHELKHFCININAINEDYYNEYLGDTSILMTSILEEKLLDTDNWEIGKWLDDCLLTKAKCQENKIFIWGVIIWGRLDTTKQWTDPLYFEIQLNDKWDDFIEMTFLLGEVDSPEIAYEEFNENRGMWDRNFYSNKNWNPVERNWNYVINLK